MAEPKTYLKCSAKLKANDYGQRLLIGVKADDLIQFARDHANERGYVNLIVTERKAPSQYGDTHSVYLDTWVKSSGREGTVTTTRQAVGYGRSDDDAPF